MSHRTVPARGITSVLRKGDLLHADAASSRRRPGDRVLDDRFDDADRSCVRRNGEHAGVGVEDRVGAVFVLLAIGLGLPGVAFQGVDLGELAVDGRGEPGAVGAVDLAVAVHAELPADGVQFSAGGRGRSGRRGGRGAELVGRLLDADSDGVGVVEGDTADSLEFGCEVPASLAVAVEYHLEVLLERRTGKVGLDTADSLESLQQLLVLVDRRRRGCHRSRHGLASQHLLSLVDQIGRRKCGGEGATVVDLLDEVVQRRLEFVLAVAQALVGAQRVPATLHHDLVRVGVPVEGEEDGLEVVESVLATGEDTAHELDAQAGAVAVASEDAQQTVAQHLCVRRRRRSHLEVDIAGGDDLRAGDVRQTAGLQEVNESAELLDGGQGLESVAVSEFVDNGRHPLLESVPECDGLFGCLVATLGAVGLGDVVSYDASAHG